MESKTFGRKFTFDMGERPGTTVKGFARGTFVKTTQYAQFSKRVIRKGDSQQGEDYYEKKIYGKIEDICISMKATTTSDLPETSRPSQRSDPTACGHAEILRIRKGACVEY